MLSTAGFLKINLDILVIYVNYCIYIMKHLDIFFGVKALRGLVNHGGTITDQPY